MKKIKIKSDKKLKEYIILEIVIILAYLFCIISKMEDVISANVIKVLLILATLSVLYTSIKIISEIEYSVWLGETSMKIGSVFPKTVYYNDIKSIFVNEGINISFKNASPMIKLRTINPERNKNEYIEILDYILDKCGIRDLAEKKISPLIENKKNAYREPFGELIKYVNLYLKLLLISSIGRLYTYLVQGSVIEYDKLILYSIIISLNAILIYIVYTKYKYSKQIIISFSIIQFLIFRIFIDLPNWIYSIIGDAKFHIADNIVWLLALLLTTIFIFIVNRYFKTSELAKDTFVNRKLFRRAYSEQRMFNIEPRMKKYIIAAAILLGALIIFSGVLIIISEINTDKNYYDSIDQIQMTKYSGIDSVYIEDKDYAYIITNGEGEELLYKNADDKYIVLNNWHEETKSAETYFEIVETDLEEFSAFVDVYQHNNYYIISIERYFYKKVNEEALVYDNFGEWKPFEAYGHLHYFKVLDSKVVENDYQISVDIDGKTYYLIGIEELHKVE